MHSSFLSNTVSGRSRAADEEEEAMKTRIFMVLIVFGLTAIQGTAQNQSELDRIEDKLTRQVASKMPGWKYRRGQPMQGSSNVVVGFWVSSNRVVKVSIMQHESAQHAKEVLRGFVKYESQKEELKGLGDEAYGWGYGMSNVVFTRGNVIVYVSTYAEVESDPEARSLSPVERGEREKSEMKRWSREFAKHAVNGIDLP
jgi:hypothetical protein